MSQYLKFWKIDTVWKDWILNVDKIFKSCHIFSSFQNPVLFFRTFKEAYIKQQRPPAPFCVHSIGILNEWISLPVQQVLNSHPLKTFFSARTASLHLWGVRAFLFGHFGNLECRHFLTHDGTFQRTSALLNTRRHYKSADEVPATRYNFWEVLMCADFLLDTSEESTLVLTFVCNLPSEQFHTTTRDLPRGFQRFQGTKK